jgi:hypothetical protein
MAGASAAAMVCESPGGLLDLVRYQLTSEWHTCTWHVAHRRQSRAAGRVGCWLLDLCCLLIRAVQSSPFPFFAARRRGGPGARGWVGASCQVGDPRARSRTPPTSAPFAKKVESRFQDVKLLCSKPKSATNRRVNQVLKRSPRVTDHGCCS